MLEAAEKFGASAKFSIFTGDVIDRERDIVAVDYAAGVDGSCNQMRSGTSAKSEVSSDNDYVDIADNRGSISGVSQDMQTFSDQMAAILSAPLFPALGVYSSRQYTHKSDGNVLCREPVSWAL